MGLQSHSGRKKKRIQESPILDPDKVVVLFFCLGLSGLFAVVFNMQMVLATLRPIVHYLTRGKYAAVRSIRHRRKARHA